MLRRHRAARVSLAIFALLVLVACFAELIAADLPIACSYKGQVYVLPAITKPAALASSDCARLAQEPGTVQLRPLVCHGPRTPDPSAILQPPTRSRSHPLGTDALGRDVFAQVVYGTRTALTFALTTALLFLSVGAVLGALAGLRGGVLDSLSLRLVETMSAFPPLVLTLGIQALVGEPNAWTLLGGIALTRWPEVYRVVRAEVRQVRDADYVLAATALGASPARIMLRHIAPNARTAAILSATFGLPSVLLTEASLTFLRVGLPPDRASWAELLSQVRAHPEAYWLLAFPGAALLLTLAVHHVVGEALRDALDPHAAHSDVFLPSPGADDEGIVETGSRG
jgi:peptide/nickel transport system permease protein